VVSSRLEASESMSRVARCTASTKPSKAVCDWRGEGGEWLQRGKDGSKISLLLTLTVVYPWQSRLPFKVWYSGSKRKSILPDLGALWQASDDSPDNMHIYICSGKGDYSLQTGTT